MLFVTSFYSYVHHNNYVHQQLTYAPSVLVLGGRYDLNKKSELMLRRRAI